MSVVAATMDRTLTDAASTVARPGTGSIGLFVEVVCRGFKGNHIGDLSVQPLARATAEEHRPDDDKHDEPDDTHDGKNTTLERFVLEEGSGCLDGVRGCRRAIRLNDRRQSNDMTG